MNQPRTRIVAALTTLVGAFACDVQDACDPGYYADHGSCYPNPTDAAISSPADAGAVTDAASQIDAAVRTFEGFGRSCQTSETCGGGAPVCGAPRFPICTAVNCLADPSVCPPLWTCVDIAAVSGDPNIKSACVEL